MKRVSLGLLWVASILMLAGIVGFGFFSLGTRVFVGLFVAGLLMYLAGIVVYSKGYTEKVVKILAKKECDYSTGLMNSGNLLVTSTSAISPSVYKVVTTDGEEFTCGSLLYARLEEGHVYRVRVSYDDELMRIEE